MLGTPPCMPGDNGAQDQSLQKKQELKRMQAEEEVSTTRKPKNKAKTTQYSILQEKQRRDEVRKRRGA